MADDPVVRTEDVVARVKEDMSKLMKASVAAIGMRATYVSLGAMGMFILLRFVF